MVPCQNVMDFSLFSLLLLLVLSLSLLNSMVELALGACLYNGHVQITLLNNFVFDEFFFFLTNPHFKYIILYIYCS